MAATACLWLVDDEGRRTADRLPFLDERGELDVEQALGDLVRILEALDAPQIFAEGETVVDADEVHSLAESLVPWSELSDAMDLDEISTASKRATSAFERSWSMRRGPASDSGCGSSPDYGLGAMWSVRRFTTGGVGPSGSRRFSASHAASPCSSMVASCSSSLPYT